MNDYIACGIFWSVLVICTTLLEIHGYRTGGLWFVVVFWVFFGFPKSKKSKKSDDVA